MARLIQDAELRMIWDRLAGPRPEIITLQPYKRESIYPGPKMGVYWKFSELVPRIDVDALPYLYFDSLVKVDPVNILPELAAINNLLLIEAPFDPRLHNNLNGKLLRKEFQNEIGLQRSANASDAPENRVVFHRLNLLLNMKLLLGTTEPQLDKLEDDLLIGDLSLLGNDFLSEDKWENDRDLILEVLPTWEIFNTRDVAYSMSRYDFLIRDYVSGNDVQIQAIRDRLKLTIERYEGLLLDEYLTLIFGIYSLVQNKRACVVSSTKIAENLKIEAESIASFFKARSLSTSEFRERFAGGGWTKEQVLDLIKDHRFVTDTTPIRRYPFVEIDSDKYLVLDFVFVVELLTSGLYWSIFESLPSRPSRDREHFAELWGRAFELYAVDLLSYYYGTSALSPLKANVPYVSDGGNGQIDGLLDYGNEVLLFEMKASLLRLDAKCNRDWEALEKELTTKFVENEKGKPKALRQLARAATAIARGGLFDGPSPDKIFPVLVVDEKAMECLGMNSYLNQLFRGFIGSDVAEKVRPLTLMSIDELEELLPYVAQAPLSWRDVLQSRFKGDDVEIISVHQTLYNIKRDKAIPFLRNEFLVQRYKEMFSRIKNLFSA